MTLEKIAKFAETRDAKAFKTAISARLKGALEAQLVPAPTPVNAQTLTA